MNKILSAIITVLFVLVGLSITSNAQTRHPWSIDHRENRQQRRITQGVRSGELTAGETLRLETQQARFDHLEERLRESGDRLTPREHARLERYLNRSSRDIYRLKHNERDAK